ncbi:hypothetical protein TNCV_3302801 [Trichonephila clavipes]|nr:hypothetical protein TNCV_3302801 [Trichonephila clavipes]
MICDHFRARDLVQRSDLQKRGRCSPESAETGSQLPRDQEERGDADLESSLHVLEKAWFNAQPTVTFSSVLGEFLERVALGWKKQADEPGQTLKRAVTGRLGTGGVCVCDGQVCPDVRQGTMMPWARRLGGRGEESEGVRKRGRKRVRERERTEGGERERKKKSRARERGAGLGERKCLSPGLEWKDDERRWR